MITGYGLLIAFVISIGILLVSIIKFKVNPFLALLITSIITGFMVRMPINEISTTISTGFGNTLGSIGIVIGLGIIFGNILSESRATESIAKGLLAKTGEKNSALAVTTAGFLISIPVFMDAAFVIMMPIIKYVSRVTKKSLMVFVCALGVGTIVGHALVIPTPGPLAVAANVNANVGSFILYSIIVAFPAALIGGWIYGKRFEKYPAYAIDENGREKNLEQGKDSIKIEDDDSSKVPGFGISMFSLLFPILLILISNVFSMFLEKGSTMSGVLAFIGDKNIAILLGILVAMGFLKKYINKPMGDVVIEAADSAGLILLITGSGGAFGSVINASGIGNFLVDTMSGLSISVVVLGFLLSALLRISQGSATVALVTTSSILGPTILATGMSPVLVGLAICAGGVGFSLPNDSGFWVLSRFSGLSVKDTLNSWTIGGTIAGVVAFIMVLLLSVINGIIPLPGL
ncbi:GntP family permease [Clostridioides difficile]|uniref:GntP family permease n=1 Tax=Clostridioides difficile TaxID=1496 RepID=UPI0009800BC1|nr:gluconate:H+ symporter [Clostridioides difficile]EKS6835123.1 GntP family permease [Clostridioides difficile]MCO5817397.1 GntP family permease [Clostridioides difficile]MDE3650431.1 gluconate:H+ symporter [Clostridioides difficile]MDK3372580.1 gluconate:H+ symporter [Clostridioides difficile]SJW17569.1 gluconate permease [Clostridioides difficile]